MAIIGLKNTVEQTDAVKATNRRKQGISLNDAANVTGQNDRVTEAWEKEARG